jgi:glycine dehydrogenase subunit 1
MHHYIPNTDSERAEMLGGIGFSTTEDLFSGIPKSLRLTKDMKLPPRLSEHELSEHIESIAAKNTDKVCFAGGGCYDHYIPSVVRHLTGRQEFYTAYTPYQAEVSQGTLQVIFEYQTMICELTGMDASNASMYDGATACAEAAMVANAVNGLKSVCILDSVNPEYIDVCKTYARFKAMEVKTVPYDKKTGTVDMHVLREALKEESCAVIAQNPNYFGILEDMKEIGKAVKETKALFVAAVDPLSLALIEKPSYADIVVGEGQPFGNPMNFGGPGLGFFACKNEFLRKMPGRIAGQTTDKEGKRGFVLTIQAREQHIRREKATSNICSNHALNALAATIYLSVMGQQGLNEVAELCLQKTHYMYHELVATGLFEPVFSAPFLREFVVRYKGDINKLMQNLNAAGFLPGIELKSQGLENCLLIAVTEKRTVQQIDDYVNTVRKG